jgi:hypothetical protein
MLILLTSCSTGVSQEQYDKTSNDLATARAQIQSLQGNLTALQIDKESIAQKSAEALAYTEFLDVLMYPSWQDLGVTPRFDFPSELEWFVDLHNRADAMGDTTLSAYIQELQNGNESAMANLLDYPLQRIEEALK